MPSRGSASDLYQPLDPFSSAFAPDAQRSLSQRSRSRCFDTDGRFFNFTVGCVIFLNAIFLCIEADLGLLGVAATRTVGLENDMGLLGMQVPGSKQLRAGLAEGIEADRAVRTNIEKEVNATLHKDIDLLEGLPTEKPAAYTVCEYFFVLFYILEIGMRICDVGFCGYWRDPWSGIDVLVASAGLLDLGLPFFMPAMPSTEALNFMSFLRLVRVLRIIRLLRVCRELRVVSMAFASAFHAVVWTGALVLVVDVAVALVLTSLIGQKAHLWGDRADEIRGWFGSIGRSLQTLASVGTLSGWDEIASTLEEVIPRAVVAPAFVVYITICSFTMACLVAGIVSDSFAVARSAGEARRAREIQEHRATFAVGLTSVLSQSEQAKKGHLTSEEFKSALETSPAVLSKLRLLDIETQPEELQQLYDRLAQDPTFDGAVRTEALAEAMTHLGSLAEASELFDLRCGMQAARREATQRAERVHKDTQAQIRELLKVSDNSSKAAVACNEVAAVKEAVAALQKEVGSLGGRLQLIEQREERNKQESLCALAAVSKKIEDLAAQANDQAVAAEKAGALNAQLIGQELANKLSAELSQRLSAAVADQVAAAAEAAATAQAAAAEAAKAAQAVAEKPAASEAACPSSDTTTALIGGCADGSLVAEMLSDGTSTHLPSPVKEVIQPSGELPTADAPSSTASASDVRAEAPADTEAPQPEAEAQPRDSSPSAVPQQPLMEEQLGEPGPEAAAGPTTSSARGASPDQFGKQKGSARGSPSGDSVGVADLSVDEILTTMLSSRGGEQDGSSGGAQG